MNNEKAKGVLFLALRIIMRFKKRIVFLAFCVALGVSFLFAIGNLTEIITQKISGEARSILAADVEVYSYRQFTEIQKEVFASLAKDGNQITETIVFSSMVRNDKDAFFLASIKGIENNFPLYGNMKIEFLDHTKSNLRPNECWIDQAICKTYDVKLGDFFHIGAASFKITGIITKEPGRIFSAVTIAPRIMISLADIEKTELIQFGSRVRYSYFVAVGASQPIQQADVLYEDMQSKFTDAHIRITSYKNSQTNIRNIMQRQSYFFLLVSVVTLIIGIVGMSASMTTFLHEQLEDVGTFRALGMETSKIFQIYFTISVLVGLGGGILGCIIGYFLTTIGLQSIIHFLSLNIDISASIYWKYFFEAILLACFLTVFINIIKIYALAITSPMDVIRGEAKTVSYSPKWQGFILFILAVLLYFYIYYKSNFELASYFSGAIIFVIIVTYLLISFAFFIFNQVFTWLPLSAFIIRNGIRQLVRQRARNKVFLLSLTIGFTLILTLNLVYNSLSQELFFLKKVEMPNIFLANIYQDQLSAVKETLKQHKVDSEEFSPLVRARLKSINGLSIEREDELTLSEQKKKEYSWRVREYSLTYKDILNDSEEIVAGSFWQDNENNPHISLEKDFARQANLHIGDILEFDIQGRSIEGKVTSIRKINWMSMKPNFFVIMPENILKSAPQNIIASFRIKTDLQIRAFQEEYSKSFPNILIVNVGDIMNVVYTLLNYFLSALQITAWFCVVVGIIILAGTMVTGYNDKLDQVGLFKTMGCTKQQVVLMDICEFVTIGMISAVISVLIAFALTVLHNYQLDIETHVNTEFFYYLIFIVFLPVVVGLLVNRKTYKANVIDNLREAQE